MSKKSLTAVLTGLLLSSLLTTDIYAAEVQNLYGEEVPVLTQGRQERFSVLQKALRNVLIRVSGRSDVAQMPGMDSQLKQASRFVQQYRYRTSPEPVIEPDSGKETNQVLWIRFNEKAVNQLLLSQRLPVWGKTRPAVLVWLVIDDRKQRQLISNDSNHEIRHIFNDEARVRGLPLRFPLLDLTDRTNISISDIWANFEDSILAASRRYQAEAVLVGRVYQGYSGAWNARWSLYNQGRRQDWESGDEQLATTVAQGVNQSSDYLASRFAQVQQEGEQSQLLIKVNAVKGLAEFNKVRDYLDSLTAVTRVQPYLVSSNEVTFQLTTRSGRLAVEQAISLGSTLVAEQPDVTKGNPVAPQQTELLYRLIQ
ncbi:MAG: DUF2066 domain-containing protein [Gammaproteobacteria bacterium]